MLVEILIFIICAVLALYIYSRNKFSYFKKKGVVYDPPVPLIGNMAYLIFRVKNFVYMFQEMYSNHEDQRYFGFFDSYTPVIMIRDPELIRMITVKDFDHFVDHRKMFDGADPLFGSSLFALTGDKWRDMRATLSPAFTGSKLRHMVPFISKCARETVDFLIEESHKSSGNGFEVELADLYTRYTNDVIASVAFGFEVNSNKERENDFFVKGKRMTNFTMKQFLKAQVATTFPKIGKLLKWSFIDPDATEFFRHLVTDSIKHRQENNICRNDMIHLLMEAKKGTLKHETHAGLDDAGFATVEEHDVGKSKVTRQWSDDELAAQAFLFFFAGFDTASTVLCYATHELGVNPDHQQKLREEVDALGKDDPTYEDIQNMQYLDMVVSETMRLWPPALITDRMCTKPYELPASKEGGEPYMLKKGDVLFLGVMGVHRDAKYWEEPEKFNPERFNDENKHKIQPFTYLPFGAGPRNCIGSRFALMDVKVVLYFLIKRFNIEPCKNTMDPIKFSPSQISMKLKDGFNFRLVERK